MPLTKLESLLPPLREWAGGEQLSCGDEIEAPTNVRRWIVRSPEFHVEKGRLITFSFQGNFIERGSYRWGVASAKGWWANSRTFDEIEGESRLSIAFRPSSGGPYHLLLEHIESIGGTGVRIAQPSVLVQRIEVGRAGSQPIANIDGFRVERDGDLYLPHWGAVRRYIHQRCRSSRRVNNLVAAIEMRLGCEELLSLPQYMAICPTGQCNALCDFCSVTTSRSGIIKKQLPFNKLDRFLAPVSNTIQMYGIEGNGEPTLYSKFPELVESLTRGGADAYLITNGSRLRLDDVPLLMALVTINFSLNAATAETHRRVMKLKNFDEITAVIKALVRERGRHAGPQVFVSYVVTSENVDEVQEFLRFAECDLGVDAIMIRPLSELGNELGAVEDLRGIVPHESDIRDMLDAVREYQTDVVPRRSEIRISPATFLSYRQDPVGRMRMPRGYESRILAPRREFWDALHPDAKLNWHLNSGTFSLPAARGTLVQCEPIDVQPNSELTFKADVTVSGGAVVLNFVDQAGAILSKAGLNDTGGRKVPLEIRVPTTNATTAAMVLTGQGAKAIVTIDFGRLRTPVPFVSSEFRIPSERRWEQCVPGAVARWQGNTMWIKSETGGGPYLFKSYAVPCLHNFTVELAVRVDVFVGSIRLGVLDASGQKWLESFDFEQGCAETSIFFDTADNDAVRLVISAAPNKPVEASVEWRESREASSSENLIRLPDCSQWIACSAGVFVRRAPERLLISWRGAGSPYLVKSAKFRCPSHWSGELPFRLHVREGCVGVGVLDASGSAWVRTDTYGPGEHDAGFFVSTGENRSLSFVVFAVDGAAVNAEFAWSPVRAADPGVSAAADPFCPISAGSEQGAPSLAIAAEMIPDQIIARHPVASRAAADIESAEHSPPALLTAVAHDEPGKTSTISPIGYHQPGLLQRIRRWARGDVIYVCQKPWTDMHNFTVDGRVDICCIATGASQKRYQLGNLKDHTFQQIWNGEVARQFRRTVNGPNPLPPCARCPMTFAYQGRWFDPEHTYMKLAYPLERGLEVLGLHGASRMARNSIRYLLARTVFRGFRSPGTTGSHIQSNLPSEAQDASPAQPSLVDFAKKDVASSEDALASN